MAGLGITTSPVGRAPPMASGPWARWDGRFRSRPQPFGWTVFLGATFQCRFVGGLGSGLTGGGLGGYPGSGSFCACARSGTSGWSDFRGYNHCGDGVEIFTLWPLEKFNLDRIKPEESKKEDEEKLITI